MSALSYISVCSGIEAASVAWEPLGWQAAAFSEIEPFPSAVLAHHWPHVPNLGDFTAIDVDALPRVDLLVGGTPCQAFSFAGNRRSLADARGNLSLAYVRLAHELADRRSLRQAVWENVPGVLSTDDNAFGCFLGALVGADDSLPQPFGERWPDSGLVAGPRARAAWRILDAQYFGLAQRRRRVFVVVDFGGGADPAAVLFERQGVRRNPPARGEARQGVAGTLAGGARQRGGFSYDDLPLAHTLRGEGFDASEDGTGRGIPLIPVAFGGGNRSGPLAVAATLTARGHKCDFEVETFIAFNGRQDTNVTGDITGSLNCQSPKDQCVVFDTTQITSAVRRLTPTECERLQGFPDGHTAIVYRGKPAADGPRYKALGNSKAVPVVRWIGEQIAEHLPAGPRP